MELTISELYQKLKGESAVQFSFVKKDGSTRNAVGTLNENLIPSEHKADDPGLSGSSNLKYYDLEKNGWRSLATDCSIINLR